MKGIILAGGLGTRLFPITKGTSKQLLPVHDKPMIYYPLSVLLLSGIKDILIISTPDDLPNFIRLLGDGKDLGISLVYKEQKSPDGLAQAFIIGEEFIGSEDVCMILGDNIFNGNGFSNLLNKSIKNVKDLKMATIFGYYMNDPKSYGVLELDSNGEIISIEEKPKIPKGNHAVVGLYFYPNSVINIAKKIIPSKRGELEITSVNLEFLKKGNLMVEIMGKGFAWLDTGTHESLRQASEYIELIEKRQGIKIGCIELVAYEMGFINEKQLLKLVEPMKNTSYGKFIMDKLK